MTEQELRAKMQETLKDDMKEILDGPMCNIIDIIGKVYEKGFMKGLEFSAKFVQSKSNDWHKVIDILPPVGDPKGESDDCVIAIIGKQIKVGGKNYMTGFYDSEVRDWYIYGTGYSKMTNFIVTDWMFLNKPEAL